MDITPSSGNVSGYTRRDVLRRGARIGAAAWVVPVVMTLALDESAAAAASGTGRVGKGNAGGNGNAWGKGGRPR